MSSHQPASSAQNQSTSASATTSAASAPVHLPCRGCQESCPHYLTCDGKPWRDLGVRH